MAPASTDDIVPFRVAFDPDAVDDLRGRLRNTRWPEQETVGDWSQGVPLAFLQGLATYWCDEYDFAAAQERMNAWPQFTTRIDDLDIHFVHARSPETGALPIVITHGWPGTYVEFLQVIGPLTDPVSHGGAAADAFHVVCPSLPGFGFSSKPTTRGRGVPWIGDAWATLMARLGYRHYGAQGGDWGAAVTNYLGETHRDEVAGIHVNMPLAPLGPITDDATDFERQSCEDFEWHQRWGTGYQYQQSSRPQTLGYSLVDSPAGQLAWIVEKFWAWTDCNGDPYAIFSREQLLDNVTIYWLRATGASSGRLYWESASTDPALVAKIAGPITVPAGSSVFPREIRRPSRRWAEQVYTNLHYWNHPERGGHFAAFEQPALFVDEVRSSFRSLR
jgi:pimeloyl-ACP methyl ester carboxylesterase